MVEEVKEEALAGAGSVKTPSTEGRAGDVERMRKVASFFTRLVTSCGAVQPSYEWDKARAAYTDEPLTDETSKNHTVNLWRVKIDTQAAFMDSEPARVQFFPAVGQGDDNRSEEKAEVEGAVWSFIERELRLDEKLDAFRHSADVCNVGFVAHMPNVLKWLPDLQYLRPEQVSIDGGCGMFLRNARWVAYWTLVSPEELAEWFPGAGLAPFAAAAQTNGHKAVKEDDRGEEQEQMVRNGRNVLNQCRVWRVFLKGSYALYDRPPENVEPTAEEKRPGVEGGPLDARRYMLLVEGVDVPLIDRMGWPELLLLDDDEWPITMLRYNMDDDDLYGFTDYRHERRLLDEIERVVKDIVSRHGLEGLKFGTRRGSNLDSGAVQAWLESRGIKVLDNMLDEAGNPLVGAVDIPGMRSDDMAYLTLLIQLYDQISMLPRAARGDENPEKTATASQLEHDIATARAHRRLAMYEDARAEVARKCMQMAHAMIPKLTRVRVGEEMQALRWADAEELVNAGGATIDALGAEAICGAKGEEHWLERPESMDDVAFRQMVLRSVRVSVESGSTSGVMRAQRVTQFQRLFESTILPAVQMVGAPEALVAAVKKLLTQMGLDEYESITEALERAVEMGQAQGQPGQPGAEGGQGAVPGAPAVAMLPEGVNANV